MPVSPGSGGETSFGRLGVAVQPQKGTALIWPNVDETGEKPNSSHYCCQMLSGNTTGMGSELRFLHIKQLARLSGNGPERLKDVQNKEAASS